MHEKKTPSNATQCYNSCIPYFMNNNRNFTNEKWLFLVVYSTPWMRVSGVTKRDNFKWYKKAYELFHDFTQNEKMEIEFEIYPSKMPSTEAMCYFCEFRFYGSRSWKCVCVCLCVLSPLHRTDQCSCSVWVCVYVMSRTGLTRGAYDKEAEIDFLCPQHFE